MADKNFPVSLTISAKDRASVAIGKLSANLKKLSGPISGFGKAFGGVGTSLGRVRSEAAILGVAIAGAGFAAFKVIKGAVDAGDKLGEMAQRVGLGVDAYAQLGFAAAQADVEQEAFNGAMDQFNKRLGEAKAGTGPLLAFLKKVRPELAHSVLGAKTTEEALGLMTTAFEKVTDPGKRAALAAAVFGRSGLQMGQFLGQGTEAIKEQRKRLAELLGPQEEYARLSGVLDNSLRETETAFDGVQRAMAVKLFPALKKLSEMATEFLVKNREGIAKWATKANEAITKWVDSGGIGKLVDGFKQMADKVEVIVDKLGGLKGVAIAAAAVMAGPFVASIGSLAVSLSALIPLIANAVIGIGSFVFGPAIAAIGNFVLALRAGYGAMAAFNLVLISNPIGMVVIGLTALAGVGLLVYKNWEPLKLLFGDILDDLRGINKEQKEIEGRVDEEIEVSQGPVMAKRIFKDRPTLGATGARPQNTRHTNDARVSVSIAGPPGTRATIDRNSKAPVDLSTGPLGVSPL